MAQLKGVITAIVTPFTAGGAQVDLDWIPWHLDYLRRRGVGGILALGTNGEAASLSLEEKKQVIDQVMASRGELGVIIGTGSTALPETIELSRYALAQGADAILVIPPFYFKSITPRGLISYYRAVFQALPPERKVILYHIPNLSGVEIGDELVDALLEEHPSQLLGIKDTSRRRDRFEHYVQRYPQLRIYGGSDELVGFCFRAGAAGVISAVANVFPKLVISVYQAWLSGGDVDGAQVRLSQVRQVFKKYPTRSATKHLLHIFGGLPLTSVRPPLTELSAEEVSSLERDVAALLS